MAPASLQTQLSGLEVVPDFTHALLKANEGTSVLDEGDFPDSFA